MSTLSNIEAGSEAERENRRVGVAMDLPGARSGRVPAKAAKGMYYEFKPLNIGRWIVWGLFAAVLLLTGSRLGDETTGGYCADEVLEKPVAPTWSDASCSVRCVSSSPRCWDTMSSRRSAR